MGKEDKTSRIYSNWQLYLILLVCFLLIDTSKLKNVPNYIYYVFMSIGFFISGLVLIYYFKGTYWYKEVKSIIYYLIALLISGLPLSFFLITLLSVFIVNYNFESDVILQEKCLVTHVSSGKYGSLSYEFRDKTFSTKSYYYQDYKNCGYNKNECYILLTIKEKPLGMFYVESVKKIGSNG